MNAPQRLWSAVRCAGMPAVAALCCLVAAPAVPAAAQEPAAAAASLEIAGAVQTPLSLSAADLQALPRTMVRVGGQNGQATQVYEGVALAELLQRAGVPQGGDLGGPWMAAYALATAADGYRVAFSLAELNSGIGGTDALVADTLDGAPLGEGLGPFRLIVPNDKRAARWVRNLKSIAIAGCESGC